MYQKNPLLALSACLRPHDNPAIPSIDKVATRLADAKCKKTSYIYYDD